MLPYSFRKDYLSFTDKKWEWKYNTNQDGLVSDRNPILSELKPSGVVKEHLCGVGSD